MKIIEVNRVFRLSVFWNDYKIVFLLAFFFGDYERGFYGIFNFWVIKCYVCLFFNEEGEIVA